MYAPPCVDGGIEDLQGQIIYIFIKYIISYKTSMSSLKNIIGILDRDYKN